MASYFALFFLAVWFSLGSATRMTHQSALRECQNAGIYVHSSGGCSDRYNSRCTSLDGINYNTIKGIIAFKRVCGCPITITGGTEVGHNPGTYSHANGYKLDIARNTCVTNFIQKNFYYYGMVGGYKTYKNSHGHLYADEHNHWDVTCY